MNEISEQIIGCAFSVANGLGCGFLEKVYENALAHELRKADFIVDQQHSIEVRYDRVAVGTYRADLFVQGAAIVELKAVKALDDAHVAQGLNYLWAAGLKICLLLNFGSPRLEVKRLANRF